MKTKTKSKLIKMTDEEATMLDELVNFYSQKKKTNGTELLMKMVKNQYKIIFKRDIPKPGDIPTKEEEKRIQFQGEEVVQDVLDQSDYSPTKKDRKMISMAEEKLKKLHAMKFVEKNAPEMLSSDVDKTMKKIDDAFNF